MISLTSEPWFGWALAIIVGFPVLLFVLTELHTYLLRRASPLARPVGLLRNYALPAGALLLLLTKASQLPSDENWVRVVATVFGFLVLVLILSALNVALFSNAARGSWRERLPSIFVEIGRLVLIIVGLGILFSWVWGADVAGLFTALGVTSIVIGLALQNAVGSVISGLLLLFEQPFRLGDWLDTGSVRGRVVEVNWRAVHIDTGNGVQIVPNASLAGSSFTNLSDAIGTHTLTIETAFAAEDRPDAVAATLQTVAADLPTRAVGSSVRTVCTGPKTFQTTVALASPALDGETRSTFLRWIWYASRRAGLHLDGAADGFATAEANEAALRQVATTLHLSAAEIPEVAVQTTLERYGVGETIQRAGRIPDSLRFVIDGQALLAAVLADGELLPVGRLDPGEFVGQTALTRQPVVLQGLAATEVSVLRVPRDVIDGLVQSRPALAHDIGQVIDSRRRRAADALAGAGLGPRPGSVARSA